MFIPLLYDASLSAGWVTPVLHAGGGVLVECLMCLHAWACTAWVLHCCDHFKFGITCDGCGTSAGYCAVCRLLCLCVVPFVFTGKEFRLICGLSVGGDGAGVPVLFLGCQSRGQFMVGLFLLQRWFVFTSACAMLCYTEKAT